MKTLKAFFLFTILLAIVSSCQKDDDPKVSESIQSAEDNAMIETEFSAVFEVIDDVADLSDSEKGYKTNSASSYTVLPSGAIVVFIDSLWNDGDGIEFYIDYGEPGTTPPKGLLCKDGRYRSGRIDATLTDHYFEINSLLTITIPSDNDYFVGNGTDMFHISGMKTVTRTDSTTRHIVVAGAQAAGDNGTITWNADRYTTKIWDDGPGLWGDEFILYGSANGTNINNIDYTATVAFENPLYKKLEIGCASTFVSGAVTIENENGGLLELDYDPYNDQACDKVARVTVNGFSRIIFVR